MDKTKLIESEISDSDSSSIVEEFEVEKIIRRREKEGSIEYYIKWKGYSETYNTWEKEENLNCPKILKDFKDKLLLADLAICERKVLIHDKRVNFDKKMQGIFNLYFEKQTGEKINDELEKSAENFNSTIENELELKELPINTKDQLKNEKYNKLQQNTKYIRQNCEVNEEIMINNNSLKQNKDENLRNIRIKKNIGRKLKKKEQNQIMLKLKKPLKQF